MYQDICLAKIDSWHASFNSKLKKQKHNIWREIFIEDSSRHCDWSPMLYQIFLFSLRLWIYVFSLILPLKEKTGVMSGVLPETDEPYIQMTYHQSKDTIKHEQQLLSQTEYPQVKHLWASLFHKERTILTVLFLNI